MSAKLFLLLREFITAFKYSLLSPGLSVTQNILSTGSSFVMANGFSPEKRSLFICIRFSSKIIFVPILPIGFVLDSKPKKDSSLILIIFTPLIICELNTAITPFISLYLL